MKNAVIDDEKTISNIVLKYESALQMLETQLKILIKEYEVENKYNPVEHIKSRIKSIESATTKLKRKGYEVSVDNLIKHVHDMVGIRIVCSFLPDIYALVEAIEQSNFIEIIEKKDYISLPKDSGYTSYHLIVKIPIHLSKGIEEVEAEIQIRTMAMDFWASLDHKIQYKFSEEIPLEVRDEMYKCAMDIKNLDHKMMALNHIVKYYK